MEVNRFMCYNSLKFEGEVYRMALIRCPECGREISDKAEVCVHCGIKISGMEHLHEKARLKENEIVKKKNKKMVSLIPTIVTVAALAVIGWYIWYQATASDREDKEFQDALDKFNETNDELEELERQLEYNERLIDEYEKDSDD